jgi:hypothetical protein
MAAVDVKHTQEHELMLEWDSSASNDMIADSTLALITGIDKSPASVKRTNIFISKKTTNMQLFNSDNTTSFTLAFTPSC